MLSLRPSPRLRRMAAQVLVSTMLLGTVGVVAVERPAAADSVDDAKRKVRQMADQLEAAEAEADRLSEELRIAEDDKLQLEIGIVQTEAEIAVKQTELGGLQTEMSDLAVEAFVGGGRGGGGGRVHGHILGAGGGEATPRWSRPSTIRPRLPPGRPSALGGHRAHLASGMAAVLAAGQPAHAGAGLFGWAALAAGLGHAQFQVA
mgnify:CR=1 FL=1